MHFKYLSYVILGTVTWGLSPIFYAMLSSVSSIEIVAHRSFWSAIFLLVYIYLFSGFGREIFRKGIRELWLLFLSGILIAVNWYGFIYAVNSGNALQASLGYYIFPLVAVFLGIVFNSEKFTYTQIFSISLVIISVISLVYMNGEVPGLALILAFSFGFYGLIKSNMKLDPISSVTYETILVTPLAILIMFFLSEPIIKSDALVADRTIILLVFSGLITAVPLVLFSTGTKVFSYATVGLIQYLNPTIQFLIAIFYFKEVFEVGHALAFSFIWLALFIYSFESISKEFNKTGRSASTLSKKLK
ncbi:EamA family transporter RarD [Paracoccaceae bacterium]|nr:EamA family transporter RarD [Paracoccaceae bacterium]